MCARVFLRQRECKHVRARGEHLLQQVYVCAFQVCVCMCVCMCVYACSSKVCVCAYVRVHVSMHVCAHVCVHVRVHCDWRCAYAHARVRPCVRVRLISAHIHTNSVCVCSMYVCTCWCMFVCTYISIVRRFAWARGWKKKGKRKRQWK